MTKPTDRRTEAGGEIMDTGQVPDVITSSRDTQSKPVYISDTAPEFELLPHNGVRYDAVVPDTYDIHERARAVQNVLTRAVDPDYDQLMYFSVSLGRNPASMAHGISDICTTKFMQALSLVRLITGDDSRLEVDAAWHQMAFKQMGPDGLTYFTVRPYMEGWIPYLTDKDADFFCYPEMNYIPPFAIQYLRQPDPLWDQAMRKQVEGVASIAVDRGDWAYIPLSLFPPGAPPNDSPVPFGLDAILPLAFFPLQGLGVYHRITGYEPAGQLVRKFCHFLKDHARCFDAQGRFLPNDAQWHERVPSGFERHNHFHCHTLSLINMLEYAIPAEDSALLEFITRSFEWARAQGELTVHGSKRRAPEWNLGYFPEQLDSAWHEEAESCEIADMIGIGLKLSAAGIGDYWDDVDRWIRNQFAENQLMDTAWAHKLSASFPQADSPGLGETDENVIERNRGAFAGWAMPNAWMNHEQHARTEIMHCCTGNGARAIYYIWEHILDHDGHRLRVNLLLNRASRWADIDSHLPYRGQVDIHVKQPLDLAVRIPGWVDLKTVRCVVNGADRQTHAGERYLDVGAVTPGDEVVVIFPISETKKLLEIEKRYYEVIIRGADVVQIEPPGVRGPFYQRAHYRGGETRWRNVQRFVSDETVAW